MRASIVEKVKFKLHQCDLVELNLIQRYGSDLVPTNQIRVTLNRHQSIFVTSVCFQIITLQSSLQLATMLTGMAVLGAHATSRTQSIERW